MRYIFILLLFVLSSLGYCQNLQRTGRSTNSSSSATVSDSTTNSVMFPLWVTATSGSLPVKTSGRNLCFIPIYGQLGLGISPQSIHRVESNELYAIGMKTAKDTNFICAIESDGTGTRSFASFRCINNQNYVADFSMVGSGATAAGIQLPGMAGVYTNNAVGMAIMADNATGYMKFSTGGTAQRMMIDAAGLVALGSNTPTVALDILRTANDGNTRVYIKNASTGAAAQTLIQSVQDAGGAISLASYSSGFTTAGLLAANVGGVFSSNSGAMLIGTSAASGDLIFINGGTAATNEKMRLASTGKLGIGLNGTAGGSIQLNGSTSGNVVIDVPAAVTSSTITLTYLVASTYTPSLTNVTNVAASTAYKCTYMRVGNVINVSGLIDIDITTTNLASEVGVSLPVASDIIGTSDCTGVFANGITTGGQGGLVFGDTTNNRARFYLIDQAATGNITYGFSFQYLVQ